jgi:phosphoenolpyruvate carboxykinase (GTP)
LSLVTHYSSLPPGQRTDIDLEGLDISPERFAAVQAIDVEAIKREILTHEALFLKLAGELPKELIFQRELLVARL